MEANGKSLHEKHLVIDNPNLKLVSGLITTIINYDWISALQKHFMPENGNYVISELDDAYTSEYLDALIQAICDHENSFEEVEKLTERIIESFYLLWRRYTIVTKESNPIIVHKFESAASLNDAFKMFDNYQEYSEVLSNIKQQEGDLLQAALVCGMLGYDKSARTLEKEFIHKLFLSGNELYKYVQLAISNSLGRKSTVREAGINGNNSRHRINRQVKEKAMSLYLSGSYRNPRQAAKRLLPQVVIIASELGSKLEWETNGFDRLYGWLRAAKNDKEL